MKWFWLFCGFLILGSCKEERLVMQTIDFKTDYLFNYEIAQKIASDTTTNSSFTGFKYQMAATNYATKGSYKEALILWDSAMIPTIRTYSKHQIDSVNALYNKVNAANYIIKKSAEHEIVIINEAHHSSLHRVFTASLLQGLYDKGYRNLGLEGLGNGDYLDTELNNRNYPVQETGFYTKDPQFGILIRTALELGYFVFPYESGPTKNGKEREIEQAKNIKKILDSIPRGKTLIHCGFAHVLEGDYTYNSWGKTMAGRLTEYTSLDPLTINQVEFSEKGKSEFNHPLLKAVKVSEPSVLLDKNNNPYRYVRDENWTDIAVFHPNTSYIDNRPNWMFLKGRKQVMVSLADLDLNVPIMVMAFEKGEEINKAIPVDIVEVEHKEEKVVLGLRSGKYTIVVTNKNTDSRKFDLEVD
jgi:hypothetical protein